MAAPIGVNRRLGEDPNEMLVCERLGDHEGLGFDDKNKIFIRLGFNLISKVLTFRVLR